MIGGFRGLFEVFNLQFQILEVLLFALAEGSLCGTVLGLSLL